MRRKPPFRVAPPRTPRSKANPSVRSRHWDQIASFSAFAGRNATLFDALLALIWISSPVAGLRPLRAGRAGRTRTWRMPRSGIRILLPFFKDASDILDEAGEHGDCLLFGYAMIVARPLAQVLQGDDRR